MAQVLALAVLDKFGGDHISETRRNLDGYVASHQEFGQSDDGVSGRAD